MTDLLDSEKQAGFSFVRSARDYIEKSGINSMQTRRILPKTKKTYIATTERLLIGNTTPIAHAKTKATFYAYRAAWIFTHAKEMDVIVKKADRLYKKEKWTEWRTSMAYLQELLERVRDYSPDPYLQKQAELEKGLWAQKQTENKLEGSRSRSKKSTVRYLPERWQESILDSASEQYKSIIAVLGLTGCRPEEFEKGIEMDLAPGLSSLTFTILGAKTHGGKYGQQWRKLTVNQDSDLFRFLVIKTVAAGGKLTVQGRAHAISEAVARLGKQMIYWDPRHKISAYSFRHTMKSNLRADGYTAADIAQAMGHCSADTQRYYANPTKGSGGSGLLSVEAEKSVEEPVYTHGYKAKDSPAISSDLANDGRRNLR